jgi:uncharacterized protein
VGSVAGLWRFPVKSMQGEQLAEADVTDRGVIGDRAYALIDTDTGKVVSAKSVRLYPGLFGCKAMFVESPHMGGELPPVEISLPNGTPVRSDAGDVDAVLSAYFKRGVTLARTAPNGFTIEHDRADLDEAAPRGRLKASVAQKLGAAFFAEHGIESPVPVGSFFDVFPLSVLTTSTLDRLHELSPLSQFDQRRFRMNVIVRTDQPGFVENEWVGHELGISDGLRLNVACPDPRCVMTTLAQDELPQDTDVLRTLVRHNMIQVAKFGQLPCAGVYAVVATPGRARLGDPVTFA